MDWIYLDNNATTQPAAEVLEAMAEINTSLWANPSSVHRFGQMVRQRVELARQSVAQLLGCRDRDLLFTSGGTESNNLAIRGCLLKTTASEHPPALITTTVEHAAIRQPGEALAKRGVEVVQLPVSNEGLLSPAVVEEALDTHAKPGRDVLLSVQWANNETGAIQPMHAIAEAAERIRQRVPRVRLRFHSDATQAVGKLPMNVSELPVDLLTFAGHKFHGPKGTGGLYIRPGVRIDPQNLGGPQERDRRGGTENTPGIVGLGIAAQLAMAFLSDQPRIQKLTALRDQLEQGLLTAIPTAKVNGPADRSLRLWNTANIGFPPLEAEAILLSLSEKNLCASAGAACSSGSLEPSPVLLAMHIPEPIAHGSVRFSLSRFTTETQIHQALAIIPGVIGQLGRSMPISPTGP